ncbi:hypothetical protein [Methylorubrum extorquens]|uniref:Uncharacterized protein n=1 Tax=Methylorubrum extorquens (strain ATCC 14718 / DSM 1338 / JCM 2805 / NCIMB 9133 / AM1) TaxID=272630 RepID=C5B068_METEA|nr:hypothetical protein [Methylorubrum extorquens]ACS39418.1 Hypothetical protein MexAM1_META1p1556 [Methylorubrum extorquens AM1]MCP1542476.1 hypothetical protein [Methylorubrum extorquens]MCP1590179.1 hypothetical protein [Methylorubrum extorquens]
MRGGYSYSEPPPGAVTCRTCGRMNIGISRAEAERRVVEANAHRRPGDRRPPVTVDYYRCCARPRLRPARLGDCPDGSTYGSVLCEGLDGGA